MAEYHVDVNDWTRYHSNSIISVCNAREPMTMQDIADALSVSRITVWKALSNRPGVSDSMRAQIHQKATEMGYFHTPSQDTTATVSAQLPPHSRTVAVAVCRPESSLFWMQIIHQIAKDLSKHNVNLMYTYLPTNYKAGYAVSYTHLRSPRDISGSRMPSSA